MAGSATGGVSGEKIWLDGEFVDWSDANVHILTHTLHYGLGAFEGVRCYDGTKGPAIFRLQEHTERLRGHIMRALRALISMRGRTVYAVLVG